MALYVAKLKPGSDIDYISDHFEENTELWVKNKLIHLNMFVFESSPELAHSVLLSDAVVYVKQAADVGIIETKISAETEDDSRISEVVCEGIQSSTNVGEFAGEEEYYSHLELISNRDFSKRTRGYHPVYTGKNVDCYIIDTGVKTDHPLLKTTDLIDSYKSGFRVKGESDSSYDDNGHGTEIALFITGETCGVARDVNIIPLKVVNKRGSGSNVGIAIAINEVIEHHLNKSNDNPSVINYSLGMMPSPSSPDYYPDATGDDVVTLDALKLATEHGIHVVTAAGNGFGSGSSFIGPMMSKFTNGALNLSAKESGNFDPGQGNPIVVGSTQAGSNLSLYKSNPEHMAYFSNYGLGNTINAPGSDMVIPRWDYQPEIQEVYRWRNGTSFSCPVVAGLVCLYLEENPTASVMDVKNWITENATTGTIKNLMDSYELVNSEFVFELGGEHVTINLSFDLPEKYFSHSTIQIEGLDGGDMLGFDGWYELISIESRKLIFDFKSPSQISGVVEKSDVVLSFLDDTHEHTDGIMEWQSDSSTNRLVRHESISHNSYFKIFTVEQTPNVIAYNPFQHSNISFSDEMGQTHSVQEGVQPEIKTPRFLISDKDIGTHAKFSFLYDSGETEVLTLPKVDYRDGGYFYEISTPKSVVSFYRGVDIERVKNSVILDADISFSDEMKSRASKEQLELMSVFENFEKKRHITNFDHSTVVETHPTTPAETAEQTEYDVVELFNSDFKHGTLRITKPGYYFLREDVLFHPNPDNDFFPTHEQVMSGLYPMGRGGAYHLGFFAAVTIECDNVIFDLSGHTIAQTKLHNLQQRFFANIELANAPFIPAQGPHSFSESFQPAKNVMVTNGTLDVSSHHGVHANLADNVILHNLEIKNFEVAGVALNGTDTAILSDINIRGTDLKTKVMSTFSHAVFIKRHLEQILRTSHSSTKLSMPSCGHTKANTPTDSKMPTNTLEVGSGPPQLTLNLASGPLNIHEILQALTEDLDHVKECVLEDKPITNYFKNESGLYDGNMYGVVLHVAGVVVHDFLHERTDESVGNENILINGLTIRNIVSKPVEVLGVETTDGKIQTGPFGDVFHPGIASVDQGGKCVYVGNSLSNSQLFLEKYEQYSDYNDLAKIESSIIAWAETKDANLFDIMEDADTKLVPNMDSMAHTMKGNIGMFMSGANNVNIYDLDVSGVECRGDVWQKNFLKDDEKIKGERLPSGGNSFGVLITASSDLNFFNNKISNIMSDNDSSHKCEVRIMSGDNITGVTETCVMATIENSIKLNEETTCLQGKNLNITFEYASDETMKVFFLVKSESGTKKLKYGDVSGTGTKTKEFTYRGDTPTKLTAVLAKDFKWNSGVAFDKIVPSDCSVVKVNTATNFLDEEIDVDVSYNLPEQMDLVVQVYSDSGFVRSTRIKNMNGKGHLQKNIKLKGNTVATKVIAFASKTNWKNKIGHHRKGLESGIPVTGLTDQICLSDNELTTSFKYHLPDARDIVFQLYSDDGIIRSVREKNLSGKGDLYKKIKFTGNKKPTRLVAFVSKGKWKDRIGQHVTKNIQDCTSSPAVGIHEETMCFYDNKITGKLTYDNLPEEMDVVMNVYSESGFEQSMRVKKLNGSGELDAEVKLKKNFSPSRIVVFLTKGKWKDRVDYHKIDVVGMCEVESKEDQRTGNMFIPVCTEDARICDDGSVLVRDPRNNCEFPPCKKGDALMCTADVVQCKGGEYVGRNPYDDCNFYPCGDMKILPIEDGDELNDDVICPADVKFCKDGGVVSRDPRNGCKFSKCPEHYVPHDKHGTGTGKSDEEDDLEPPMMCSKEMKKCPDGTLVGRNARDGCRFYECPDGGESSGEDERDELRFCTRDIRMCPDGTVVGRDPKNDCKFKPCPPSIMRGIHLTGVEATDDGVIISVELLEGLTTWQYQISDQDEVTVANSKSEVSVELDTGIYKIKVWGVDTKGNQIGRIFYEKIEISPNGILPPKNDFDYDEFTENKTKWESSDIKNYAFDFKREFYGIPEYMTPVHVVVRDGVVENVVYKTGPTTGAVVDVGSYFGLTPDELTFDGFFNYVQKKYDEESQYMTASYDEQYGFVKTTYVDEHIMIADEEMFYEISNFKIIDDEYTIPELKCLPHKVGVGVHDGKYVFSKLIGIDPQPGLPVSSGGIDSGIMEIESLQLGYGVYHLLDVPENHPISFPSISVSPVNEKPIVIEVSGGTKSAPYYTFKLNGTDISSDIADGTFKFMKSRTYAFINGGISALHPMRLGTARLSTPAWITGGPISANTAGIKMTIPDHYEGDVVYYCENHEAMTSEPVAILTKIEDDSIVNYYHGDLKLHVNSDFGTTSYECFYHGYMGGENNVIFSDWCGGPSTYPVFAKDAVVFPPTSPTDD